MTKRILLIASAPLEQVFHTADFIEEQNPGAECSLLIKLERARIAAERLPGWKIITYKEGAISPWNKALPGIEELRQAASGGVYYACNFNRRGEYLNVELAARCVNLDGTRAIAYPIREISLPLPEEATGLLRSGDLEGALDFMKEYRKSHAIEYAMRSTVSATAPVTAQIFTSLECNYKCVMCWVHSEELSNKHGELRESKFLGARKMEMKDYAALIDDLAEMGTEAISVSAGGEPLLDANLRGIATRICERGMDCEIYTNGFLMNRSFREFFISSGVKKVRISLNAGSSESFSKVHNISAAGFEKVVGNTRALVKERNDAGSEWPKVGLSFIISRLNVNEAGTMLDIARETGVDWVSFQPVWFNPDRPLEEIELDDEQVRGLVETAERFMKTPQYNGLPNVELAAEKWSSGYWGRNEYYYKHPCYMGWFFSQVNCFGDVFACACTTKKIGSIFDAPFKQIWNSPEYVKMREEMLSLPEKRRSIEGCTCFSVCPHVLMNDNLRQRAEALRVEEAGRGAV